MQVDIFADIVCPWCYIGERRFEAARSQADVGLDVTYQPYQLDPNAPDEARPLTEYLHTRFGNAASGMQAQVSQAAATVGITINWDKAIAVNTREAHRLMRLARLEADTMTQRALLEALFAAHFTHGLDISDRSVLIELADGVGIDTKRARAYLENGEGLTELHAEFDEARRLGIQGVPAFVFNGKYLVEGAQPTEMFIQVIKEMAESHQGRKLDE